MENEKETEYCPKGCSNAPLTFSTNTGWKEFACGHIVEDEKAMLITLFHEVNMLTASHNSPTLNDVYDLLENRCKRMYGPNFYENWLGV